MGRKLRDTVLWRDQAFWTAPRDRRDHVDITIESQRGRLPELLPIRHARMAQSAFGFLRGAAAIMAGRSGLYAEHGCEYPDMPRLSPIELRRYRHTGTDSNFRHSRFRRNPSRAVGMGLKRLATSFVVAGQHIGLRERDCRRAAFLVARAYREQMAEYSQIPVLDVWYDKIDVARFLKVAPSEDFRERVRKNRRTSPQGINRRAYISQACRGRRRESANQGQPSLNLPSHSRSTESRIPRSACTSHRGVSGFFT